MGEIDQVAPHQKCHACGKNQVLEHFSKSQRKKQGKKRCQGCVHHNNWEVQRIPGKTKLKPFSKAHFNKASTKTRPRATTGGR